ncbi:MAG: hypothetical protein U9R14_01140 [Patescibacteria group bacterium]|nr:hypothetical protein [Patescibacteria group bacterium]
MNKRIIKQIIVALVFFLILFTIGFLVYYFNRPQPNCFDGVKNQGEEEIDCGGPCQPCELIHIKEIEVLSAKAILNQNNFYDVYAQIKNPNQNYGSGKVLYEFKLYDLQNNVVAQHSGSTFILPGQTKYLVQTKIESPEQINAVNLFFGSVEWEKPAKYQVPEFIIKQKEYRLLDGEDAGYSQAKGVLVNKNDFDFGKIDIDVLLFNSSYQLVGLNAIEIRTLLAGEEREFAAFWFNKIAGQAAFMEVEAETNIFDASNYLPAERGEAEEFQEY